MNEKMRGRFTRLGVVRDSRRRSWIVICPVAEFVVPTVNERRPEATARLGTRPRRRPGITINGVDAFVLSLIAGLYGSLFYCLAAVVR